MWWDGVKPLDVVVLGWWGHKMLCSRGSYPQCVVTYRWGRAQVGGSAAANGTGGRRDCCARNRCVGGHVCPTCPAPTGGDRRMRRVSARPCRVSAHVQQVAGCQRPGGRAIRTGTACHHIPGAGWGSSDQPDPRSPATFRSVPPRAGDAARQKMVVQIGTVAQVCDSKGCERKHI